MMVFAGLLTPRKKLRTLPLGKATFWMQGHIWLGLLTLPMILFHSGFGFGGPYTQVLMWLFLGCYASGIYGLIVQQIVPRILLSRTTQEMIYERIDPLVDSLAKSGEAAVKKCCGVFDKPLSAHLSVISGPDNGTFILLPEVEVFVFGREANLPTPLTDPAVAPRHFEIRHKHGKYSLTVNPGCVASVDGKADPAGELVDGAKIAVGESLLQFFISASPETRVLKSFFVEEVWPYLSPDPPAASIERFHTEEDIANAFGHIRKFLVSKPLIEAAEELEESCRLRRELRLGKKLHRWLHLWLVLHIPLAAVLLVGSFIHALVSLVY
jgi:hypothetical protein